MTFREQMGGNVFQLLWCSLRHRKHHHPFDQRRIRRILYLTTRCEKCGCVQYHIDQIAPYDTPRSGSRAPKYVFLTAAHCLEPGEETFGSMLIEVK